jgi:hypothetical protein
LFNNSAPLAGFTWNGKLSLALGVQCIHPLALPWFADLSRQQNKSSMSFCVLLSIADLPG